MSQSALVISNEQNRQIIIHTPRTIEEVLESASLLYESQGEVELYYTEEGSEDKLFIINQESYDFARQMNPQFLRVIVRAKFVSIHASATKKDIRVLLLGCGASGKTTLLYYMKLGEIVSAIPTIGFNVETVEFNGRNMTIWDVGGQPKIRVLWRHYFQNSHMVIFMIDATDRDYFSEAVDELSRLCHEDELREVKYLILLNVKENQSRCPKDECISIQEVISNNQLLKFFEARGNNVHIAYVNCFKGAGIDEAFSQILAL